MSLRAVVLNCTLKPSPEASNTEALAQVVIDALMAENVSVETIRLVDLNIKPGVKSDEGDGDDWPAIHEQILNSEILLKIYEMKCATNIILAIIYQMRQALVAYRTIKTSIVFCNKLRNILSLLI